MEIELKNDLVVKCNECQMVQVLHKDSLEVETSSYERNMGDEVEYIFGGEFLCEGCGNSFQCTVSIFEYPIGALNYSGSECNGAHFVFSPEVNVNYYEFDYDDNDEKTINEDFNCFYANISRKLTNRAALYKLSAREFETLVAELFRQEGFATELTPETRDGGCDVIATKNILGVPFMLLIECKKYSIKNPVGVSLVRSLLGVQEDKKANKAVLVTTSRFTKSAREFAKRQQHLISLVDIDDLLDIMEL